MLKTYDSTLQAYTEHLPKHYDKSLNAWVESSSAKTYNATEGAWVEHLYADYFTHKNTTKGFVLDSNDDFRVSRSGFWVLYRTSNTSLTRKCRFLLDYKWSHGDVVEFDLVMSNGKIYIGNHNVYMGSLYGDGAYGSSSGGVYSNNGSIEEHVTVSIIGSASNDIDGQTVKEHVITIDVNGMPTSSSDFFVSISNVKINGKKYGFKE